MLGKCIGFSYNYAQEYNLGEIPSALINLSNVYEYAHSLDHSNLLK